MRSLGAVSYSVYVFYGLILHTLAISINGFHPVIEMTPEKYWLVMIPVASAVVIWSTLTYRFIEKPFIRGRRRNVISAETVAP
jgi:peptidoglycan/LPS O-acetylase OafA/YrhL